MPRKNKSMIYAKLNCTRFRILFVPFCTNDYNCCTPAGYMIFTILMTDFKSMSPKNIRMSYA